MSEQQTSGTGKEGTEADAVKKLLGVRGIILDLAEEESRLDLQGLHLQQQIADYQRQIDPPARERIAALQQALSIVQERLTRLKAEKRELIQQQDHLLDKIDDLRAEQQRAASKSNAPLALPQRSSVTVESAPPRSSRFLLLSLGMLVIVLTASFFLAHALYAPDDTDQLTYGDNGSNPHLPAFQPNGKGPTDQVCQARSDGGCFSPEDIQQAFNITRLYQLGYDGRGQTIVLLGAGNTTTLQEDLRQFDETWGLPQAQLSIMELHGPPNPYLCDDAGSQDRLQIGNTLAVEWAHAIAPGARLVLLIGSNGVSSAAPIQNCAYTSIKDDLAYALNNHLGQIIAIHDTYSELGQALDTADQKADEQHFLSDTHALFQQAAQQQVTVIAPSGDTGATTPNNSLIPNTYWQQPAVSWPASDPGVLAVGGTSLSSTAADTYDSETVWNDPSSGASGGGLSAFYPEPEYQQSVPDQQRFQERRGIPDVAFPARGFLIYGGFQTGLLGEMDPGAWNHWDIQNSTGAGAACWAGLIAIADQIRGKPLGLIQPALYSLHGQTLHDVTRGDNSFANVKGYQAQPGYDLVTGWGTPDAENFLIALIQATDHTNESNCQASGSRCP